MEEEKYCPNCGRYVGSLEVCPYCGTKIPKHTSYYYAKYGSLTFAVLGVLFLLVFAQSTPVQYVHIGDIGPTYNYALVRISGVVSSAPSLVVKSDGSATLYINVDDGTGVMSIHVYNPTIGRMASQNKVPGFGDFVDIKGEIYIRGTNRYMIINDPAQITIKRAKAVAMNISAIRGIEYPYGNYLRVCLVGNIVDYRSTFSGAYVLNFTDGTGYIDIYVPSYFSKLYGFDAKDFEGEKIRLTGSVQWYGSEMTGEWEIVPATMDDFRVIT